MRTAIFFAFVICMIIGCDEKKNDTSPSSSTPSESTQSVSQPVQQAAAPQPVEAPQTEPVKEPEPEPQVQAPKPKSSAKCYSYPDLVEFRGVDPPDTLRVDCNTKQPLDPAAFQRTYAAYEAIVAQGNRGRQQQQAPQMQPQPQYAAQQQAAQGPVYDGEFSANNPLGGMPNLAANPAAEQQRYDQERTIAEASQQNRDMARLHSEAVYQCRKVCLQDQNPSLCRASCPTY